MLTDASRVKAAPAAAFAGPIDHLWAHLEWLELLIRRHILRLRAAQMLTNDEFKGLFVADEIVDAVLADRSPFSFRVDGEEDAAVRALTNAIKMRQLQNHELSRRSISAGVRLPLAELVRIFELRPFELGTLLLAIAPELDLRYETLISFVQNDVTRKRPLVDLAFKLLCNSPADAVDERAAFSGGRSLMNVPLLHLEEDENHRGALLASSLRADRRIVDFVLGATLLDERLRGFVETFVPDLGPPGPGLPAELLAGVARAFGALRKRSGVLALTGRPGVGKRCLAAAVCAEFKMPLLVADLRPLLNGDRNLPEALRLACREARLMGAGLYVGHLDMLTTKAGKPAEQFSAVDLLTRAGMPIFVGSEGPLQLEGCSRGSFALTFEIPLPSFSGRVEVWRHALGDSVEADVSTSDVESLASKFVLSTGQVKASVQAAAVAALTRAPNQRLLTVADLHAAARSQSNQGLRQLAQKIEPTYSWDQLVLPPLPLQQLREVVASVKLRHVVYSAWGFERSVALGKGLNVLFSGPSGTGKTMAAEVLAAELSLDMYKIDLSTVVSKYIGETEQNLSRIFAEAQSSNAILFFDEADALFGKRSEVNDAHDRYANIEVAYLLQKMEEYEGIVILATNLSGNLDEAFARRMHHIVDFPIPNAASRERIWRGVFPAAAPLADDINLPFLAQQFDLVGGSIRNIAIAAAFMAAESGSAITMQCVLIATSRELQKAGRLPTRAQFRDFYDIVRDVR